MNNMQEEYETDSGKIIIKQSGDMNGCVNINVFWDTKNIGHVILRAYDYQNQLRESQDENVGVVDIYFKQQPVKFVHILVTLMDFSLKYNIGLYDLIISSISPVAHCPCSEYPAANKSP